MYLEIWMIVVLTLVWGAGLIHVAISSHNEAIAKSVEGMFTVLEEGGFIKTTEVEEEDGITNVYLHKPTGFKRNYERE